MGKKHFFILSIAIVNILSLALFTTAVNAEILTPKTSGVIAGITIDGVINETAWELSDHKVKFWIDADPNNLDGYNFMYLGEDVNNLYIALDLCSDNTSDTSSEWISVWLITSNRSFTTDSEWANYKNNGTEAFTYNVALNQEWNYSSSFPRLEIDTECRNNTLKNYDIEWGFDASPNNATDHRMYEMKIPKSEVEHYNSSGYLGVLFVGYGTLTVNGTNTWVYPLIDNSDLHMDNSSYYVYYNMKGLGAASGGPIPGYDIYVLLGVIGVSSVVIVKRLKQFKTQL